MAYYGMFWYILVYYGISWYIMVYFGIFWYIMIYIKVYYGILWYTMVYYSILWYILVYYGILWYIVVYYSILWYILGILWYIAPCCRIAASHLRVSVLNLFSAIVHITRLGRKWPCPYQTDCMGIVQTFKPELGSSSIKSADYALGAFSSLPWPCLIL